MEEHAILLCNYFNFLDQDIGAENRDIKSYLIYGKGKL